LSYQVEVGSWSDVFHWWEKLLCAVVSFEDSLNALVDVLGVELLEGLSHDLSILVLLLLNPSLEERSISQVLGVNEDHTTPRNGGWRSILKIKDLKKHCTVLK
jgi:hypothetical protein